MADLAEITLLGELFKAGAYHLLLNQFIPNGMVDLQGFTVSYQNPDGVERYIVTSAGVVVLTLNHEGKLAVLLVNEDADRWDIPSGKAEPEDVSPAATAARELTEETSLQIQPDVMLPLRCVLNNKGSAGAQYFAVLDSSEHLLNAKLLNVDEAGRVYYSIEVLGVVNKLVLEPIDIFLGHNPNQKSLLVTNSHHPWASFGIGDAVEEKLGILHKVGHL